MNNRNCGLALTIVSEILTNHHLPFSLTNRGEGGAEFRVRFGEEAVD